MERISLETMTLVTCAECNKKISSFANACPSCGFPIKRKKHKAERSNYFKTVVIFIFFMTVLGAIVDGCTDAPQRRKEANDAYNRLKKMGFTDKQIYEMGK